MTWTRFLRPTILLLTVLATVAWALLLGTAPVFAAAESQSAPTTVLVQFDADLSPTDREAMIAGMGGELTAWMPQINVAEVRLHESDGMAVAAATQPLTEHGEVNFAEVDASVSGAYLPTDPAFDQSEMVYGLAKIQAQTAWNYTTGSADVVVAVVDTGIKLDHPEFAGRLTAGHDFVNDDDTPDDDTGHGTHVAGILAAGMDNGVGMAGVCAHCMLMPVKVLGAGNVGSWSDLAQGILYATDHGADIINLSLGGTVSSQTLAAAVTYAQEHGVLLVAAAGNYNSDQPYYPAALDGVISVGATTAQDNRWQNSNFGPSVDVSAPGDLIYSSYHELDNMFGGYMYLSGTSMATPYVSGLAGLVLSLNPALTPAEVSDLLERGVDDLGTPGRDDEFGYGRINAAKTLGLMQGGLSSAEEPSGTQPQFAMFLPVLTH